MRERSQILTVTVTVTPAPSAQDQMVSLSLDTNARGQDLTGADGGQNMG